MILPQIHPKLYSSPNYKNSNINTLIPKSKPISKKEYSSKDSDTNIHYNEVILTNPKEYENNIQKIVPKCCLSPKTPPMSIPTPKSNYTSVYDDSLITTEDNIELSRYFSR